MFLVILVTQPMIILSALGFISPKLTILSELSAEVLAISFYLITRDF